MRKKFWLSLSSLVLFVSLIPFPAAAQDNPWGEVVDADGNIQFAALTDLGEIQEPADWMPSIPFVEGQATYHRYMTPSGNIVVLPSASTLFFMALNPDASGLNSAYGAIGNGIGVLETMLAGYITPEDMASLGYIDPESFWQDLIDGKTNIWSFEVMGDFLRDLLSESLADGNMYNMALLYLSGNCASAPGGCPPSIPTPPPSTNDCPPPFIQTGEIQITGGSGEGGKIAPSHPVVIGQDPEKRGVDVKVSITIPPVIYHYFERVVHHDYTCSYDPSRRGSDCPSHPGESGWRSIPRTWVECVEHTQVYPDFLGSAQVSINLTRDSRQWILTQLAQAYPGAHLIRPDFSFSFSGPGTMQGGQTVFWSRILPGIQTADPGNYITTVSVVTSGTPVSASRQTQSSLGQFTVELMQTILVEQP